MDRGMVLRATVISLGGVLAASLVCVPFYLAFSLIPGGREFIQAFYIGAALVGALGLQFGFFWLGGKCPASRARTMAAAGALVWLALFVPASALWLVMITFAQLIPVSPMGDTTMWSVVAVAGKILLAGAGIVAALAGLGYWSGRTWSRRHIAL